MERLEDLNVMDHSLEDEINRQAQQKLKLKTPSSRFLDAASSPRILRRAQKVHDWSE